MFLVKAEQKQLYVPMSAQEHIHFPMGAGVAGAAACNLRPQNLWWVGFRVGGWGATCACAREKTVVSFFILHPAIATAAKTRHH